MNKSCMNECDWPHSYMIKIHLQGFNYTSWPSSHRAKMDSAVQKQSCGKSLNNKSVDINDQMLCI